MSFILPAILPDLSVWCLNLTLRCACSPATPCSLDRLAEWILQTRALHICGTQSTWSWDRCRETRWCIQPTITRTPRQAPLMRSVAPIPRLDSLALSLSRGFERAQRDLPMLVCNWGRKKKTKKTNKNKKAKAKEGPRAHMSLHKQPKADFRENMEGVWARSALF